MSGNACSKFVLFLALALAFLCMDCAPDAPKAPPPKGGPAEPQAKAQEKNLPGDGEELAVLPEPDFRELQDILERGLQWLQRHQADDGRWSPAGFKARCEGPACSGAGQGSDLEATALGLLAFLGAGHTHKHGDHKQAVKQGLGFLRDRLDEDGSFREQDGSPAASRAQALGAFALCEAFGLGSSSPVLRKPAETATSRLAALRRPGGGWGETPDAGADALSTAWAVLALHAARFSGLAVPEEALREALAWFESAGDDPGDPAALAARAYATILLLGSEAAGREDLEKAGAVLKANPFDPDAGGCAADLAYGTFGTLAAFSLGGKTWEVWNRARKTALFPAQEREGCEAGSWAPLGRGWGSDNRLLATAIGLLLLQPYVRSARATPGG